MPTVIIEPSHLSFQCNENESLLAAATRQNIVLPNACRSGSCGICEMELLAGEVQTIGAEESKLQRRPLLACRTLALSDLRLRCNAARHINTLPAKQCAAQIKALNQLSESLLQVKLLLPAGKPINSFAGQYLLVEMFDRSIPSYFYRRQQNGDAPSREIELILDTRYFDALSAKTSTNSTHSALHPVTVFEDYLKQQFTLTIKLPFGDLIPLSNPSQPTILVTSYRGLSLCRTIVEHLQWADPGDSLKSKKHDNPFPVFVMANKDDQTTGLIPWFEELQQDKIKLFIAQKPEELNASILQHVDQRIYDVAAITLYSCQIEESILKPLFKALEKRGMARKQLRTYCLPESI